MAFALSTIQTDSTESHLLNTQVFQASHSL